MLFRYKIAGYLGYNSIKDYFPLISFSVFGVSCLTVGNQLSNGFYLNEKIIILLINYESHS